MFESIRSEPIRVMGVDPGTDTYGFAFGYIDEDKMINITEAYTVHASKALRLNSLLNNNLEDHSSRMLRINWLANRTLTDCEDYWPHRIYYESPFFSRKFMGSGEALTEVKSGVLQKMYEHYPNLPVEMISPQEGKAVVGVTGKGSQKEVVAERILNHERIIYHIDTSELDEHSTDAIVILACGVSKMDLW